MLSVSRAFHSPLLEPILKDFGRSEEFQYLPARIPLISNLTGGWVGECGADARY